MKAGRNFTPIRIASPYPYHFRKQWHHVFVSSCRILQAHEFTNSHYVSDQRKGNLSLGGRICRLAFMNWTDRDGTALKTNRMGTFYRRRNPLCSPSAIVRISR